MARAKSSSVKMMKRKLSARRHELLRTAARLFSERGYSGTTLEDIGAEMGLTRPALYHYTDSKEDLFLECSEIPVNALLDLIERSAATDTGMEQLRMFHTGMMEVMCEDIGRGLGNVELRELSERGLEINRRARTAVNSAVEGMIQRGIDDGSIRECNPKLLRRTLFGSFMFVARWYRPDRGVRPAQLSEEIFDLYLNGLRPA